MGGLLRHGSTFSSCGASGKPGTVQVSIRVDRARCLTVAAPSFVFTIGRVARMLGEEENTIYEIVLDMEPEDGCLTVLAMDDAATVALTERGIENLKELLDDLKR
jgi:hypothetical protein